MSDFSQGTPADIETLAAPFEVVVVDREVGRLASGRSSGGGPLRMGQRSARTDDLWPVGERAETLSTLTAVADPGPSVRHAIFILILLPTAAALASVDAPACSALQLEPCVPHRHLARGSSWAYEAPGGAFVLEKQSELDEMWVRYEFPGSSPVIDFTREWVAAVVEDPGILGITSIVDIVTPAPGRYAVSYYTVWVPGEIEMYRSTYDIVAVDRPAGSPTDVAFVGPYTAWDSRFNP